MHKQNNLYPIITIVAFQPFICYTMGYMKTVFAGTGFVDTQVKSDDNQVVALSLGIFLL